MPISSWADLPTATDPRIRALRDRVQLAYRGWGVSKWWMLLAIPGAIVAAAAVPIAVHALLQGRGMPPWIYMAIGVVIALVSVVVIARLAAGKVGLEVQRLMLEEGLCPSCGYNLFGIAPEADGCVCCPECGGAWRQTRIARAMPLRVPDPDARAVPMWMRWLKLGSDRRSIEDDRGRRTLLVHPWLWQELISEEDVGVRRRLRRARWRMQLVGLVVRGPLIVLLVAILAWLALAVMIAPAGVRSFVIMIMLPPAGLLWGVALGNFFYPGRGVRRVMLERALCASCAENLEGLKGDEDGCVTCPRCRAAWSIAALPTGTISKLGRKVSWIDARPNG